MNNTGVEITAGLGGFLVLFFLALAVWFLGWDLNRRLRRLRHQEAERLEAEALEEGRPAQDAEDGEPAGEGQGGDESAGEGQDGDTSRGDDPEADRP